MRSQRQKIASQTVEIGDSGKFYLNGKTIDLLPCYNTEFWKEVDLAALKANKSKATKTCNMEVVNASVVDVVWGLDSESIGVLNFASAYHPGGGFLNGSMAQEEAIAYCSDLYYHLTTPDAREFYKLGQASKTKAYTDNMIWSQINFFRKSNFDLVTPKLVNVVTSAAINKGAMKQNKEKMSNCYDIMKNRMRYILELFVETGSTDLILGAFGCGVFKNDATDIAKIWKELLVDEGYKGFFNEIIFAVLDSKDGNYQAFVNMFRNY